MISLLLSATLALASCSEPAPDRTPEKEDNKIEQTETDLEGKAEDAEENQVEIEEDFSIETVDGSYTKEGNTYLITAAGEYTLSGKLVGQVKVNAPDQKVTLQLVGASISCSTAAPVFLEDADKVEISAKKDTYNEILDLREAKSEDDETQGGGAVTAKCDLSFKGNGSLSVLGSYKNGIHGTKDLSFKNLTLKVKASDHVIKGKDSVTVESGNIIAIAANGDGIKTESTDISSKGNQRGIVSIAGGTVDIYAAQDGIDASYSAEISGDAVVTIATDSYSEYTGELPAVAESKGYLSISGTTSLYSSYRFAVYYYNEDGSFCWEDACFYGYTQAGGFNRGNYTFYYEVNKPSAYSYMKVYQFPASSQNSTESFTACSSGCTVNNSLNLYSLKSSGSTLSGDWSTFAYGGAHSAKGIKADNEVCLLGGTVSIRAKDDAVHANAGTQLENGAYGAGNVTVSGGTHALLSGDDGIHADGAVTIEGGNIAVLQSYEGVEGNTLQINGGTLSIVATDDGLNACAGEKTPLIQVTGGYLDISVSTGDTDGIDSNGSYLQTGGFVLSRCASSFSGGSGALDAEGNCTIAGGTFVNVGSIGKTPSSSSQNWVIFGSSSSSGGFGGGFGGRPGGMGGMGDSSSTLALAAGAYTVEGTSISFTLEGSYTGLWISSDQFKSGVSYTLSGGTVAKTWTQSNGQTSVQ